MKYMIMLFGDGATMQEVRSPEWIKEMIDFMIQVDEDLKELCEQLREVGTPLASVLRMIE